MRQRRFCFKDELNIIIRFGWKNLHSSGVHGWISVLRLLLCTTFYCGSACYREESQKICFRKRFGVIKVVMKMRFWVVVVVVVVGSGSPQFSASQKGDPGFE